MLKMQMSQGNRGSRTTFRYFDGSHSTQSTHCGSIAVSSIKSFSVTQLFWFSSAVVSTRAKACPNLMHSEAFSCSLTKKTAKAQYIAPPTHTDVYVQMTVISHTNPLADAYNLYREQNSSLFVHFHKFRWFLNNTAITNHMAITVYM